MNRNVTIAGVALLLLAGCSIHVKDAERDADGSKNKDVTIKSPFGGLHVRTNDVDAKDLGLTVYPGARLKEKAGDDHDNKADVNIDTPWFGLKVVALKYVSDDSQDKVWAYYKKELSKYGHVLECKPGSPDMDVVAKDDDQLTCHEHQRKDHNANLNLDSDEPSLRVGSQSHQRVVGFKKPFGGGTEFDLVYVATRGDEKEKS